MLIRFISIIGLVFSGFFITASAGDLSEEYSAFVSSRQFGHSGLVRADSEGGEIRDLREFQVGFGLDLEVSSVLGSMFWTDDEFGQILRADVDGSNIEVAVCTGRGSEPVSISIDELQGQIYWVDDADGAIRRTSVDGGGIELLAMPAEAEKPLRVVVAEEAGFLFWTNQLRQIFRADLDGKRPQVIVESMREIQAIDVSPELERVFFREGRDYVSTAFDGTNRRVLFDHPSSGNGDPRHGITVIDSLNLLIFPGDSTLNLLPLTAKNSEPDTFSFCDNEFCVEIIVASGFDPITGSTIFLDPVTGITQVALPDGEPTPVLEKNNQHPLAIAVDTARGNLFTATRDAIIRRALDGSNPMAIVQLPSDDDSVPRDLAIDLRTGDLWWRDRANLWSVGADGSGAAVRFAVPLSSSIGPIAIDGERRIIYWAWRVPGQPIRRIDRADFDGSNQSLVLEIDTSQTLNAIAVDEDSGDLYWSLRNTGVIERIDFKSGVSKEVLVEQLGVADLAFLEQPPILGWITRQNPRVRVLRFRNSDDGDSISSLQSPERLALAPRVPYGDVNANYRVNIDDLLMIIENFGNHCPCNGRCPGEVNGDQRVDLEDLTIVLGEID